MKLRLWICVWVATFGATSVQCQHAYIEQNVWNEMAVCGAGNTIPIILMLSNGIDVQALKAQWNKENISIKQRPQLLSKALKAKAAATQPQVLEAMERSGLPFGNVQPLWMANAIGLSANAELIMLLAHLPEVAYITLNTPLLAPVDDLIGDAQQAKMEGGSEPGLRAIGADELWAMGYTGNGRLALIFDTGVWPQHPSLSSRFLPNMMPLHRTWLPYYFLDGPADKASSHGTHVSGTVLGLNPSTADTVGVAYGAYFIASDFVRGAEFEAPVTYIEVFQAFEWALNPDGDENTTDDVPDVINNSWGGGFPSETHPDCSPLISAYFDAVEAAGIANVFSAGNAGPDPQTVTSPVNTNSGLVNAFAVGAVNAASQAFPIASFSSRGPSFCEGEGSLAIKPEVSGPGVNVRSAYGPTGYDFLSGTSMAAPHVSGAVLLLKEAFPEVSGEEILLALYYSATDLGEPGEDNTYGMGMINVKAAFDFLATTHTPAAPSDGAIDLELVSVTAVNGSLRCSLPALEAVAPVAVVRNLGVETVTGITIHYSVNGGAPMVYTDPNLVLLPGVEVSITLPGIDAGGSGFTELHAYIEPLAGEHDVFNNHAVQRWTQLPSWSASGDLFTEAFDTGINPELWTVRNADYLITWDTAFVVQKDGTLGYAAWLNHPDYTAIENQRDHLIGPVIAGISAPTYLQFDYYYRKRSNSTVQQDTLAISVVYNCGADESELWKKGGSMLWTNDTNGHNAFPESGDEWQTITLEVNPESLPGYESSGGMAFQFTSVNRRGNNLLIDNIMIGTSLSARNPKQVNTAVSVYPNPASSEARVQWTGSTDVADVKVYDLTGRLMMHQSAFSSGGTLHTSALARGVYLIVVEPFGKTPAATRLVLQ